MTIYSRAVWSAVLNHVQSYLSTRICNWTHRLMSFTRDIKFNSKTILLSPNIFRCISPHYRKTLYRKWSCLWKHTEQYFRWPLLLWDNHCLYLIFNRELRFLTNRIKIVNSFSDFMRFIHATISFNHTLLLKPAWV